MLSAVAGFSGKKAGLRDCVLAQRLVEDLIRLACHTDSQKSVRGADSVIPSRLRASSEAQPKSLATA